MAKPIKLAHVVYMTRRYDEMIAWYSGVFEAEVVHRGPALTFMTYDDEHHRFAIANLDLFKPAGDAADETRGLPGDGGVNHVAFTYATAGDLLHTYARLKATGIHPYWPVHHGTTLSLYYQDPDGNRVELQVDCGTPAEARAYMASAAFAANPGGFSYDPEVLLAAYERGASESELLRLPAGPPAKLPAAHGLG